MNGTYTAGTKTFTSFFAAIASANEQKTTVIDETGHGSLDPGAPG